MPDTPATLKEPTILEKINGKPRPPSPPQNQGWENGAFLPFARLHPWFGGRGWGFAVPFYFVQDLRVELSWVESRMRLVTVNHFNFIAANQVLRRLKDVFGGGGGYELPPISATVKLCYTFRLKWHSFLPPHCLDPLQKNSFIGVIHNSVADRVSASDSQSGGPGFEARSGDLMDLFSVVPSSNPGPRL